MFLLIYIDNTCALSTVPNTIALEPLDPLKDLLQLRLCRHCGFDIFPLLLRSENKPLAGLLQ